MNTPVKRVQFITFGKKCTPSRKGPVPPKRTENRLSGAEKDFNFKVNPNQL